MSFADSDGLKKFCTTAPHALPQWSERSNCVDQKMRCHRERSEASAERSRTTPGLSRTPMAWRDFSPRNSHALPQWSERSNCVDQKMRCHRERNEASAERSRTIPCLSRTPTAWRDFSPRNSRSFAAHLSADQPAGVPNLELSRKKHCAPFFLTSSPTPHKIPSTSPPTT